MDEFSASARMNHYEKGRHTPDYPTLWRIAKVLKLPPAYFYADSDELAVFIRIFNQLAKSERCSVLKYLDSKNKKD